MLDYKPYSGYIGYNLLVIYKHIVYRIRDTGTRYTIHLQKQDKRPGYCRVMIEGQNTGSGYRIKIQDQVSGSEYRIGIQDQDTVSGYWIRIQYQVKGSGYRIRI